MFATIRARSAAAALTLCALAAGAVAAIAYTPPPESYVPWVDTVVRGTVDHDAKTLTITEQWGEEIESEQITIRNLRPFGRPSRWGDRDAAWPTEAFAFLARRDHRYFLVRTPSPTWLPEHSAIHYVDAEGEILSYGQPINPGELVLLSGRGTREDFESRIAAWLAARTTNPARPPELDAEALARLDAVLGEWVDLYVRQVVQEPEGEDLATLLDGLRELAGDEDAELGRRAISTLLLLAEQLQSAEPPRLRPARDALTALTTKLPAETLVVPCLGELRSTDVFAAKHEALRMLKTLGGEPLEDGLDALYEIVRSDVASLGSRAYWALRANGYRGLADRARAGKDRSDQPR